MGWLYNNETTAVNLFKVWAALCRAAPFIGWCVTHRLIQLAKFLTSDREMKISTKFGALLLKCTDSN